MGSSARDPLSPLLEQALLGYAAGTLPCALHALIGAHLELSEENRAFVAALENSRAGADIVSAPGGALHGRDARLAAILSKAPLAREQCHSARCPGYPRALRHYLAAPPDRLPFRTVLPGISECRLAGEEGTQARLYCLCGGRKVPEHTHEGEEFTLVLSGALLDRGRRFRPGDINLGDERDPHAPMAEAGQNCLCFAVLTGRLRLTGPVGRLFNRLMG